MDQLCLCSKAGGEGLILPCAALFKHHCDPQGIQHSYNNWKIETSNFPVSGRSECGHNGKHRKHRLWQDPQLSNGGKI